MNVEGNDFLLWGLKGISYTGVDILPLCGDWKGLVSLTSNSFSTLNLDKILLFLPLESNELSNPIQSSSRHKTNLFEKIKKEIMVGLKFIAMFVSILTSD